MAKGVWRSARRSKGAERAFFSAVSDKADDIVIKAQRQTSKSAEKQVKKSIQAKAETFTGDSMGTIGDRLGDKLDSFRGDIKERAHAVRSQNSQGSGNRANRRMKEMQDSKLANEIADGREVARLEREYGDMSRKYNSNSTVLKNGDILTPAGIEAEIKRQRSIGNVKSQGFKESINTRDRASVFQTDGYEAYASRNGVDEKAMQIRDRNAEKKRAYTQDQLSQAKENVGKKRATKNAANNADPKDVGNNWGYKAAGVAVTGALVLNMSSNRGQQSNNQLYGQGY